MFLLENLHKNKKLAFLDGLLCGAILASIAIQIYRERKEFAKLYPSAK